MNIIIITFFLAGVFIFDFLPILRKGNAEKRKIVLYVIAATIVFAVVVMFEIKADIFRLSHYITKFINSIMEA